MFGLDDATTAELTPAPQTPTIDQFKASAQAKIDESNQKLQSFHATVADLTSNQIPNEEHTLQHFTEALNELNNYQAPVQG